MGEFTPSVVLVILLTITSLATSVNSFNKNPTAETFFNLEQDDPVEDLTIIDPDQFKLQQKDNNDLKATSKQFDEDNLSESDFYMSKEIYNIRDKLPTNDERYTKEAKEELAKKDRRKLREQYQIEQAVIDADNLDNFDFRKPLEENFSERRNRTKNPHIKSVNSKVDFYETFKSKPTSVGREKSRNFQRSKSPEDFGLRHTDDPPFPDLVESTNKLYDPKESDLNTTRLKVKLGGFYDESFMSIIKPNEEDIAYENKSKDGHLHNFTRNKNGRLIPKDELPDYLKDINFKYIYLNDGNKIRTRISSKLKKKMQQFLQTYTKCRISYKWKDLGPRFWPRYLKAGYCTAGGRVSCSIPPGMTCRPGQTEYKTLLRFHCGGGRGGGEGKCHWRNVQYPVVTSCTCACA